MGNNNKGIPRSLVKIFFSWSKETSGADTGNERLILMNDRQRNEEEKYVGKKIWIQQTNQMQSKGMQRERETNKKKLRLIWRVKNKKKIPH